MSGKSSAETFIHTTNTVEGCYSIFKRGMRGVHQHCAEKHLHRYLAEFDFRYSNRAALGVNDRMRAELVVAGIKGTIDGLTSKVGSKRIKRQAKRFKRNASSETLFGVAQKAKSASLDVCALDVCAIGNRGTRSLIDRERFAHPRVVAN